MKDCKILFMGTPIFAQTVLKGLLDNGYDVVAVLSQPDKPVGRKRIIQPTPVKQLAIEHNIPVYQFDKLREHSEFINEVKPDLIVTCAYGQIVPNDILSYPKYGCINVHGSLLPALRGGAPIHHSLIDGYDKTGISIMEMIDKMDAGKVYSTVEVPITEDDNLDTLSIKLQNAGTDLLLKTLPGYLNGEIKGVEQDENLVTFAWNIKKEEEIIDWNKSAREIFNLIRGLSSVPGAHTTCNGKIFKIYDSRVVENEKINQPGKVLKCDKDELIVGCGKGSIRLLSVQMEGKSRADIKQFLNGNPKIEEFK